MSHRVIQYDTLTASLPQVSAEEKLMKIRFGTCPGSDLSLFLVKENSFEPGYDRGMKRDTWWAVQTKDLPDRAIRLKAGPHSLAQLIMRYAFLDASGCPHHKTAFLEYVGKNTPLPAFDLHSVVPRNAVDVVGVPQFFPDSGVCWFASICTVFFGRNDVRDWVTSFMPDDLKRLCSTCLYSREDALSLREKLWYEYSIGDDCDLPPKMDGRNGFSEMTTLCAKMKIPLLRYSMEDGQFERMSSLVRDRAGKSVKVSLPKDGEKHLLVLRFIDGDHHEKYPVQRRIRMGGRRYRLIGVVSGQRKCGHQIGWVVLDCWRTIMAGDADLHKDDIGPLFIRFRGEKWKDSWWRGCKDMLHVSKFGSGRAEFCNLSPHNQRDDLLDTYRGSKVVGKNSLDLAYISA